MVTLYLDEKIIFNLKFISVILTKNNFIYKHLLPVTPLLRFK